MNENKKKLIIIIIALLAALNSYVLYKYYKERAVLKTARESLSAEILSNKTLNFTKLITEKIFGAEKNISFEERLFLENAARGLNDPIILENWNNFIASRNQNEAQNNLKQLLGILLNKIKND